MQIYLLIDTNQELSKMTPSTTEIHDHPNFLKLIAYDEAKKRILHGFSSNYVPIELVSVDTARGRVCAEEIKSNSYLPDRSLAAMDGYAIDSSATNGISSSNPLTLTVEGALFPSSVRGLRLKKGYTCYTATGALLPRGADAVARIEELRLKGDTATITHSIPKWKNVFQRGEDYKKGDVFFRKHQIFNSADVALLISLGKKKAKVFHAPKIGVLSIGDELKAFGEQGDKKKTVNNYCNMISGFASELGAQVEPVGICPDNLDRIAQNILRGLKTNDLLITIGGSSVGEKDLTIKAASSIPRSSLLFHGIAIVPIRPTGLVMVQGKPVIILPANAISAAASFFLIALPTLNLFSGLFFDDRRVEINARSIESFENERRMQALFLVRVTKADNGTFNLNPFEWGSNLSSNLARSNGFVTLERDQKVSKNDELMVTLLGASEMSRIRSSSS
jgi:molybdopterin molybdotransferase